MKCCLKEIFSAGKNTDMKLGSGSDYGLRKRKNVECNSQGQVQIPGLRRITARCHCWEISGWGGPLLMKRPIAFLTVYTVFHGTDGS